MTATRPQRAGRCGECTRPEADHQAADPELAAVLNALAGCYGGYRVTATEAHHPPAPPVGARRRKFASPTGVTMPSRNVTREIVTLAAARRGEPFALGLQDAFGKAGQAGADYTWACRYACRLIFRDDSDPQELVGAAIAQRAPQAAPLQPPAPPEVLHARAEEARRLMAGRPATTGGQQAAEAS